MSTCVARLEPVACFRKDVLRIGDSAERDTSSMRQGRIEEIVGCRSVDEMPRQSDSPDVAKRNIKASSILVRNLLNDAENVRGIDG